MQKIMSINSSALLCICYKGIYLAGGCVHYTSYGGLELCTIAGQLCKMLIQLYNQLANINTIITCMQTVYLLITIVDRIRYVYIVTLITVYYYNRQPVNYLRVIQLASPLHNSYCCLIYILMHIQLAIQLQLVIV